VAVPVAVTVTGSASGSVAVAVAGSATVAVPVTVTASVPGSVPVIPQSIGDTVVEVPRPPQDLPWSPPSKIGTTPPLYLVNPGQGEDVRPCACR